MRSSLQRVLVWVPTFFLLLTSNSAFSLDRDDLTSLKTETAEKVLMSFQAPTYFLVSKENTDVLIKTSKNDYFNNEFTAATPLFVNKDDVETFQKKMGFESSDIKLSNMNKLLVAMYKQVGRKPSTLPNDPDFIFADESHLSFVEMFVDESVKPYVVEQDGVKFIPAFLIPAMANQFYDQFLKSHSGDHKYSILKVDFNSHLHNIESNINSDVPIITFGDLAAGAMGNYIHQQKLKGKD